MGGRLRVSVQLIDAASDTHLWADTYDRTLDDAFAVQSEVARRIAQAVGGTLGAAEERALGDAPTRDPEAYRLYLQARAYDLRPGVYREDLEAARRLLEQAVTRDPSFAMAHVALARVLGDMSFYGYDTSSGIVERRRRHLEEAVRLAPDLPRVRLAAASLSDDPEAYLEAVLRAAADMPGSADVWHTAAFAYRSVNRWEDAVTAMARAADLNPRDPNVFDDLAGLYDFLHRYEEAVDTWDHALALDPTFYDAALDRAMALVRWEGRVDSLRATLAAMPDEPGGGTTVVAEHLKLLLWDRQADSILDVTRRSGAAEFAERESWTPASLLAAWAHGLNGDTAAAHRNYEAARIHTEERLTRTPNDWRLHIARALALAGLGRSSEARHEIEDVRAAPVFGSPFFQPFVREGIGQVLARLGDADGAWTEIDWLPKHPSRFSAPMLALDPRWDPIRGDPRVRELAARAGR